MWQSLTSFADAELEINAEASKKSYEKLAIATWELQKHIKELLLDYPGSVPSPSNPSITDSTNHDGAEMGHVARLMSSLCSQSPRGDMMSAPGAIYTPKADAKQRTITDADPSVPFEGVSALEAFLSADVPSLRWEATAARDGGSESSRLRQLATAPGRGANGQRITLKPLDVVVEQTMDTYRIVQQQQSEDLRAWALGTLRELHPDVTLEAVHAALLRAVFERGPHPEPPEDATWFKVHHSSNSSSGNILTRSRLLLSGLFHTSTNSREAWTSVTQAFTHGLVQLDAEAARLMGTCPSSASETRHLSSMFDVTPNSYESYVKDVQDKMDQLVGALLQDAALMEGGSARRGLKGLSEKDLARYRLAITPRTYLQVVGQKLLHHAAHQIPCMAELPERIPDWTIRNLYSKPFVEAIKLALLHGIASTNDAFGPCGEAPGERVRGGKLAQSLLQSCGDRKDQPTGRFEPQRQKQKQLVPPQQQQKRRQKRVADTAPAAHLKGTFDGGGGGGSGGMQPHAGSGDQGCTDLGAREGQGGDIYQRAQSHARSAVALLTSIERDIQGFEEGFASTLSTNGGGGGGASFPSCRAGPLGCYHHQQSQSQQQYLAAAPSPHIAATYLSVLREDVARVFHEMAPVLRTFLYNSVTSAVQACLAADDFSEPPCAAPLSPDTWPTLEEVQQPRKQQQQQPKPLDFQTVQSSQVPVDETWCNGDVGGGGFGCGGCAVASSSSSYTISCSNPSSSRFSSTLPVGREDSAGGGGRRGGVVAGRRGDADAVSHRDGGARSRPGFDNANNTSNTNADNTNNNNKQQQKGATIRTWDTTAPLLIDALSHRALAFVSWLVNCRQHLPGPLQSVLAGAVLECLGMIMDRLALICTSLHGIPGRRPLQLAFLYHAAACCVRRHLEALQPWLGVAAAGRLHDLQDVDLVRQYGGMLVEADDLISGIHEHIVLVNMQIVYDIVLSSLDRTNWCAFRPDVMRGQSAGPAVRVWHSMMLRLLATAALHASPNAAEWIVGQVLLESASCMAQRYLQLGPRVQMLREFVADVVHLTASVFLFCQPIPVIAHVPHGGGSGSDSGRVAEDVVGWPLHPQPSQLAHPPSNTTEGVKTEVFCFRVPFSIVRALAGLARELLTRAALLHLPGSQLEELARKTGHLVAADESGMAEQLKAASEQPEQVLVPPQWTISASSGAARLAPLPSVGVRLSPGEQAPLAPLPPGEGNGGGGGGDGSSKAALPGVPVGEGEMPMGLESDAAALTTASTASAGDGNQSVAVDRVFTSVVAVATAATAMAREGSKDPWATSTSTVPGAPGGLTTTTMMNSPVTDEQRLELWASWLPSEVVRALTGPSEALELEGCGHGGVAPLLLIPLRDRMADVAPAGRGGDGQGPKDAEGSMWRACLGYVASHASAEQVMLALTRRHELHAAVGTEPPGSAETRRVVRGLVRRLGLGQLAEDGEG